MSKPALLKYTEWEGAGGWYCNDVSDMTSVRVKWWVPARMLGISPTDYIKLIIDRFAPDNIKYTGVESNVLIYSWKSQAQMRKFKNWLNAEARKKNFII